jgi:rubrerythrin
MWIEQVKNVSQAEYRRELAKMADGSVMAQEISQKGAMHVLKFVLANEPVTERRVRDVLEGLQRQAQWITAECKRRGLPCVDNPTGH